MSGPKDEIMPDSEFTDLLNWLVSKGFILSDITASLGESVNSRTRLQISNEVMILMNNLPKQV